MESSSNQNKKYVVSHAWPPEKREKIKKRSLNHDYLHQIMDTVPIEKIKKNVCFRNL